VRHGRTAWNAAQRFQGRTDVPLSEEGRAQARAVAEKVLDLHFDRAYASDLSRALETAQIIVRTHEVPIAIDARLREFDFGAWEGLTWPQIEERFPQLRGAVRTTASAYAPQGGESFAQVRERVRAFLDDVRALDGCALVVTHAGVLHAVFAELAEHFEMSTPVEHLNFAPASITRIVLEGTRARLVTFNEVAADTRDRDRDAHTTRHARGSRG